jgi:hypothetical protein
MIASWWLALAFAQGIDGGIDARGAHLAASDGDLKDPIYAWRAERQRAGSGGVGGLFEYAHAPLVRYVPNGDAFDREVLLDHLLGFNLMGGWAPHERVAVTAVMPLWFTSVGADGPQGLGLGDVRLAAPIGLVLPDERDGGIGLSLIPILDLPSGSSAQFLGNRTVSGGGVVAVGYGMRRWNVDANLGFRQTPKAEILNLTGGPQLTSALAASFLFDDHHAIRAEANLRNALRTSAVANTQSPSELIVSGRGRYDQGLSWTAGGAMGTSPGVGAAVFRVFAGAGWTFGKAPIVDAEVPVLASAVEVIVVD